jgi:hypothetical protein
MPESDTLFALADRLGTGALVAALFVLWCLHKRLLVLGWTYEILEKSEERYRLMAERLLGTADRAVRVGETIIDQVVK